MEDEPQAGAPTNEDGETDAGVPGYRTIRPCTIGLTFSADADAAVVVSLAATARYVPMERETPEGGRPERQWRREPLNYRCEIPAGGPRTWRTHCFLGPDGTPVHDPEIGLHIRRRIVGGGQVVTATLINEAVESEDRLPDECRLFQTGLEVRAVDGIGAGAIRPRAAVSSAAADEDTRSAELLYRDVVEYAVGHGVAAEWNPSPAMRVDRVATTWLPAANVKGMSPAAHPMLQAFLDEHPEALRASWLARMDAREEVTGVLRTFVGEYGRWIDEILEAGLENIPEEMGKAARRNLARCRKACGRMDEGVAALAQDADAWLAFALANAAMDRQARYEGEGRAKRAAHLAAIPAGVHAAGGARTGPAGPRRPELPGSAVVSDRRRQDGSLSRPDGVADLPASACGLRSPRPARRGRAHALHAATAYGAAIPAGSLADLRLRCAPPRKERPRRRSDIAGALRRGRGHAQPHPGRSGCARGGAQGASATLEPPASSSTVRCAEANCRRPRTRRRRTGRASRSAARVRPAKRPECRYRSTPSTTTSTRRRRV